MSPPDSLSSIVSHSLLLTPFWLDLFFLSFKCDIFLWDAILSDPFLSFFPAYIANLLLCSFFVVFSFVFGEVVWKMDCTDPILSLLSGLNVCFFILSYWYCGMVGQCLPVYPSIFEEKVDMTWRNVPLLQDTYDRSIVSC